MFKIESYFGPLLMSYLNKYVKLEEESFKLSLWGGDVTFHNLELQYDILEDLMPLPIGFKSGQVHELNVHVPWTKLGSESVVITLNTVECILTLKSDFVHKSKFESQNSLQKPKLEKNIPAGYLKSYLVNIINNIHVKVNNLIIKFVEDDIVLSMNAKSLEYFPVTNQWSKGFIDFSGGNLLVHKSVKISDLTICLDQMDANGHIELYQEPILYRCSVESRFVLSYQSSSSTKPDFLKFNIEFGDLELNVTTTQMPMMRRLVELFYALYYNTINWDAVVGCGFSNQISKVSEVVQELQEERRDLVEGEAEAELPSWGSWAWSYVPSLFAYEEGVSEEQSGDDNDKEDDGSVSGGGDKRGLNKKKVLIFGMYMQSIQVNLKKSQTLKSPRGSQRTGRSQRTIHFMTLKGDNVGLNVTTYGLGFFNVQLGCTCIDVVNTGGICPCGQHYKIESSSKNSASIIGTNSLLRMGSSSLKGKAVHDSYLNENLFSDNNGESDIVRNTLLKLNSICSQETYSALFSQEQCLENFGALWFDYVYCMQIVKNDLTESQIDLSNLCNTDGIRESSSINLYLGPLVSNVNSYFVHNLIEITKALDISKYCTYFKTFGNDDRRNNIFFPTEDQVARMHEFIPVRQYKICLTQSTINVHTFMESHNVTYVHPIMELKINCVNISKSIPMYPKNLIDCVSVLSSKLLKESDNLLNKCYVLKDLEIIGLSMSLLMPEVVNENSECGQFLRSEIINSCNLSFTYQTLLFSDSWKTSSFINEEKAMKISNIKLLMIPSHVKTTFLIVASNYSWIAKYIGFVQQPPCISAMNRQLDDITLKLMDPHGSLLETCFKHCYQDKTYELHIFLPEFTFKCWRTLTSYFVDAKISYDILYAYLKQPLSSKIIPVLDNKLDYVGSDNSPFCLLYCQIPTQSKPVNCAFSFHCQIGSLNFMFSSQLVNWLTFPILDFDLDDSITPYTYLPSARSTEGATISSQKMMTSIRSIADGNSRPESPTVNSFPLPGHPKSITKLDSSPLSLKKENVFLANRSGWWNMFKDTCSKYFFFLQSLDVCIKIRKSKLYIMTIADSTAFQSSVISCNQWVEQFNDNNQSSIFLITVTRLALINSQRKEYLEDNFERNSNSELHFQQSKSSTFIESLPWELIFHDIQVDCVHSHLQTRQVSRLFYDSILKPVSINCTLSATPKCSSPERLDTLYSISWGIHVDITEVQPTLKQIYLIKLLDFFVNIFLKISSTEFTRKHYQMLTAHYYIVMGNQGNIFKTEETPIFKSKHSISTKSTKKSTSLSSINDQKIYSPNYQITSSKLETQSIHDSNMDFKLSFWVQCTLSQFQLIILLNDNEDFELKEKNVCLVMQVDDVTGSVDVQEKFVEIKSKFGSIFCQLGIMKDDKIMCEAPILKSGSKFLSHSSYPSKLKEESIDDIHLDGVTRHCLSVAIVRTTINNLSQRPLSSYHQFKDTESFKSYPTEFTGNFSVSPDSVTTSHNFVTQISSIIEPFELVISSYFIEQCHKLTDTLVSIYLQFFHSNNIKHCPSNKINPSSIKYEPYFISEDMPKFYLLVKSSKIIMPCHSHKFDNKGESGNDCVVLIWNKISLQPFSDNPISRPKLNVDSNDEENDSIKDDSTINYVDSEQKVSNVLDDNRQFQLNIINCGMYSSLYSFCSDEKSLNPTIYDITLLKTANYTDNFSTSIIHGQNPAFEWNYYSKMSTSFHSKKSAEDQLKPILKPIDIQIIFAGALYENVDCKIKRQLLGGYSLEVNILSSIEFLIDISTINNINSVSENLKRLFSCENIQIPENEKGGSDYSNIGSVNDWIIHQGLGHIVPCVPTNILMTTRKIQFLLFLQNPSTTKVHGVCLAISQPHMLLYFKSAQYNKLEVSLFDITISVTPQVWSESLTFDDTNDQQNTWTNNQSFILAEMRNVVKTKSGPPDLKTGVPKSFLTITFSDFYLSKGSKLKMDIARQLIIDIDIQDVQEVVGVINFISSLSCVHQEDQQKSSSLKRNFNYDFLVPHDLILITEFINIKLSDQRSHGSCFECKLGKINVQSNTFKNYIINNLQSSMEFYCDTFLLLYINKSLMEKPEMTIILGPLKVNGKMLYRKYRPDSIDKYWMSSEWFGDIHTGTINVSIDKEHFIVIHNFVENLSQSINLKHNFNLISTESNPVNSDFPVEMFYDDLRSERFQIFTKMNTDTLNNESRSDNFNTGRNIVAEDATVAFSNDGEDLAAMYWTYPETRFITSIEVKPVPFVFIEYKMSKEDNYEELQVPCQLEYWNCVKNRYELYKEFHLSENQTEKVDDFPKLENPQMITSKSWRVVFDCYARYMKVDDKNKISYSEKAMLVYLSPLVLAASMRVDSCYAPFVVKNSFISISSPAIQIKYCDAEQEQNWNKRLCKPFKAKYRICDDYYIIDHRTLFSLDIFDFSFRYHFKGDSHVCFSNMVFHIAHPFVALKTAVLTAKDVNITLITDPKSSPDINVKLGVIQAGIHQINLRQLIIITDHINELLDRLLNSKSNDTKLSIQKLLFCNFLDRKIRLHQQNDCFNYISDANKMSGIDSGKAVMLKFLPSNYYKYHNNHKTEKVSYDPIKLTLGLCSELKGTVRWTESIEIPCLNNDEITTSNLQIWNIDSTSNPDTPICSNSSNLSNSYNAKSLLLLHNQAINGLNKLILMGNTMFHNLTTESILINFSLPTELSSGFSFNISPSTSFEEATSIHINWKIVSLAIPKNVFELSFRVVTENSEKVEYRSLTYKMNVPRFDNVTTKYSYHHSIIKLKEHMYESQVLASNDQYKQILCTMEWFHLNKNEDIFLLITLSPMLICKNMMLHDVNMHLTWTTENDDTLIHRKQSKAIAGNGGLFMLTDFFLNKSIDLNASFLNDKKLLFDTSLVLTETGILDALDKNLYQLYNSQNLDNYDIITQNLASRLINIIDKSELEEMTQFYENLYSVVITITPWILVTNNTKMSLVFGFDKSIYLLEALSDFVPPQYEKPVKIGITHENEIFWSKTFNIGNSILRQNDGETFSDLLWSIIDTEFGTEAYLQININFGKQEYFVPITLKHLFAHKTILQDSNIPRTTTRCNHLTIEASVYVSNQTKFNLNVAAVSLARNSIYDLDSLVDPVLLSPLGSYVSVEIFSCIGNYCEGTMDSKWFLCVTKSENTSTTKSFSNLVSIMDLQKLTNSREIENVTYTGFMYCENPCKDGEKIDFIAFEVNSTVDSRKQKVYVDIFESKSVPIKITNHSSNQIFFNELEENGSLINPIISVIRPIQSVPFWPQDFMLEINKDGFAKFDNFRFRIKLGLEMENDVDWTDYFPIIVSQESSQINILTKKSRSCLFVNVDSSADSKIHIHINDRNFALNNYPIITNSCLIMNISIKKMIVAILEGSSNLEQFEETVSLNLDNINMMYSTNMITKQIIFDMSIKDIQLDNKRHHTGMYDFPVVLYSRNSEASSKFFHCRLETDSCNMYTIDLVFDQEMEIFIENIFLYDMLRILAKFVQCIIKKPIVEILPPYSSPLLNIGTVTISSIPLLITVHAFLKIYVSCEATSLSLPKFSFQPSLSRLRAIQRKIYEHYVAAALVRCGWVMGSFELLGNPSGIVNHFTTGLSTLICSKNIDHGLLSDFLLRIFSFCRHTTGGFVSSFTGIASSVSRNLDYLCLDNIHISRQDSFRRQYQPNGVVHGFYQGLSGFALSLLGAVAGLADHPLHDSQEALNNNTSVTIAILKGLSKGIIGVITKPLGGTAELFAQTGRGLLRTTGISILRRHCQDENFDLISKSELIINENHVLIQLLNQCGNMFTCKMPICIWSGIATNGRQQLVYLFVTSRSLLEWNIDNPLRNKFNIYNLSEFDIVPYSTSSTSSLIGLHHVNKIGKQRISTDFRINAFISDQICESDNSQFIFTADRRTKSRSSSTNSIEFVNISDSKSETIDRDKGNVTDNESIVFTLNYPSDGILDALTFLQLYRDNFSEHIL